MYARTGIIAGIVEAGLYSGFIL